MFNENDYLEHYGTPRHSGRYPWGSGDNPYQSLMGFQARVRECRAEGMTNSQIAKSFGMSTTDFIHEISRVKAEKIAYETQLAKKLHDKGWSNVKIGERMGKNESSVRDLLKRAEKGETDVSRTNAEVLRKSMEDGSYVDISTGVPQLLGISQSKFDTAVAMLRHEGYVVHKVRYTQMGTGEDTTFNVLCPPGTTWAQVQNNQGKIHPPEGYYSEDGESLRSVEPPISVDPKRVSIVYGEDGGANKEGLIELRRGVDDISLGNAKYAQVRIGVNGTHYLKGMAVYADDLPDGIDIRFNTLKSKEKGFYGVMKEMEKNRDDTINTDNPFGTSFRRFDDQLILAQRHYKDKDGNEKLSALNIVNEEGDWGRWNRALSAQFLSKQSPALAKQQLDISKKVMKEQFDEIMSLSNPTVRQSLLEDFARQCDSNAVHLQAAALPRQAQKVILPVPELKEGEIYAPHLRDGEHVVLIRYPHAGIFEIPNLVVNNKVKAGVKEIGNGIDAVGINPKTAQQLSGADFDGDSVVCIPTDNVRIRTAPYIESLKNFDPKTEYPEYTGMHRMTKFERGMEMGKITNLIADMQLMGGSGQVKLDEEDMAKAVKHSMVVVDAYKHHLDYKRSEVENDIAALKRKYRVTAENIQGASTLITRAKSVSEIPERREKYKSELSPSELERWKNGELIFTNTGKTKNVPRKLPDGTIVWEPKARTTKVAKMDLVDDAYELVSGGSKEATTAIERVYADYANAMKAMANQARKEARATVEIDRDPSAAKVYALEVASLKAKVNEARKKSPLERRAQIISNLNAKQIFQDNPELMEDGDKRSKIMALELDTARRRVGNADKPSFDITDREWEAINAGAVSKTNLRTILAYADSTRVRQLSTPKVRSGLTPARKASIRSLYKNGNGYPVTEIADMLGVSPNTVESVLLGKQD